MLNFAEAKKKRAEKSQPELQFPGRNKRYDGVFPINNDVSKTRSYLSQTGEVFAKFLCFDFHPKFFNFTPVVRNEQIFL